MSLIAFARGVPAPEMLPVEQLQAAAVAAFAADPIPLLSYGTGAGWGPLRARLAARHGVDAARVVVTAGSLGGFAMLAQTIAARAQREGRRARVIVECPSYDRPLLILERFGIEAVPVPLGPDGIDLDEFEAAAARGADFAYLIPTFQNPAGATLPEAGRIRLLEIARDHGVPVLEDDPYGLLHFDDDHPAPTSIFDFADGWEGAWWSGSFSKTIAPGLRVGWMVLPTKLAAAVAQLANDTYISASFLGQATVDQFLASGDFEPNVVRSRELLAERCARITAALDEYLPGATYTAPGGGYFIWVRLPDGLDAARVAAIAGEHGVSFIPGASFGTGLDDCVRLAFSSPPLDEIAVGIQRLAAACAAAHTTA
ncbi:MAG: PLP-dependent aminotransferase family protein [Thermoleophilia bacterium]|nr:PLP-dependent aminotransferase family protein [Thermoleophilia bacterium]